MSTDDKHGALKARLEQIIKGYADSYRSMGNIGDGQVMCESVCFDLKNNVMKNVLEAADAFALSARRPIMPIIKTLRDQRDDCAHALRRLVAVVDANFPMPAGVHPGSPLDLARMALAKVPTYEQQLRNVAEGIGMTVEELTAAIEQTSYVKGESNG